MLKDLALLVDPATKGAGSYALSLAQLPSAHLTTVPADVEPALAAYTELRYDIVVAKREDRRDAFATRAAHIHMDGLAQGLTVNVLPIDDCSDDMLDALVHATIRSGHRRAGQSGTGGRALAHHRSERVQERTARSDRPSYTA
jgi:hypothetical protein